MKIQMDGFIHAKRRESWEMEDDGHQYKYEWWRHEDMSTCNYICVCPHEIEFEAPDGFNPIPIEIENYRKEQKRIRAEAAGKINALEEQIGKLAALEFKPGVI